MRKMQSWKSVEKKKSWNEDFDLFDWIGKKHSKIFCSIEIYIFFVVEVKCDRNV